MICKLKRQEFMHLKVAQAMCALYIIIIMFITYAKGTFSHQENTFQLVCLVISKLSAFSMYPVLVVVFLSKCKATLNFITKTPLSLLMPSFCTDSHSFHKYAGIYIAYHAWIHTIFHLLRCGNQGKIYYLWGTRTGLSGLVCIGVTPFITLLMLFMKKYLNYEIRKGFHYLYFIFAISLCYHVPVSNIPNGGFIAPVMGTVLCLYILDATFVYLFMTEKIQTPTFQVLESGVQITMTVSKSFQERCHQGGFVCICLPWINDEWHAFSLFEVPDCENKRQVFIQNVGDWTKEVCKALQRSTRRPLWIQGPFASSFHNAVNYDNQILVATGIGITPIISTARAYVTTRRVNILWFVRDPDVLEFYLEYLSYSTEGWVIAFYTGKKSLNPILEEYWSHTNVRIIKGRPNINNLIPNIMYGIESERGLPEICYNEKKEKAINTIIKKFNEAKLNGVDETCVLEEAFSWARKYGFQLSSILQEIEKKNVKFESKKAYRHLSSILDNMEDGKVFEDEDKKALKKALSFAENDSIRSSMIGGGLTHDVSRRSNLSRSESFWVRRPSMDIETLIENSFEPWEANELAPDYVKALDKNILDTWGIVYCGKNKIVSKLLHDNAKLYGIDIIQDFFEW